MGKKKNKEEEITSMTEQTFLEWAVSISIVSNVAVKNRADGHIASCDYTIPGADVSDFMSRLMVEPNNGFSGRTVEDSMVFNVNIGPYATYEILQERISLLAGVA